MAVAFSIFLVSAAALGLELVLVRALSIGHWHHFSYLVISTALLGFGAGGAVVAIGSGFFTRYYRKALWFFAFGLGLTVPIVFLLSWKVPFDQLQLIWDRRQIFYLFANYLLFFVPFFCAGSFVALAFTAFGNQAHRLYFYNMVGSGVGAAGIVALMYGCSPESLLLVISFVAFVSALILALGLSVRWVIGTLVGAVVCLLCFSPVGLFELEIGICQHKALVYYRELPGAETVSVRYSPLARLDCVRAPAVRYFPGLSIAYRGELPGQMLIISDADGISAVNHFEQLGDLDCYDYMTSALAYHLLKEPQVCIIGAGGGSDVGQALMLGARSVTAVEMNSQITDLMRGELDEFSSSLYGRQDVRMVTTEGRNFLQTTSELFDIINISLLDSFSASAAGLYALNESHLYTVEAVEKAFSRLRPNGLLSVTRVLKTPPRDSLKMLATVAEALRGCVDVKDPSGHIIMIRGLFTATIVVSPQPFSGTQIEIARRFSSDRRFDVVHLPGINPNEVNRFNVLEEGPVYYRRVQQILSGQYQSFYRCYAYDIRPATDDRPYFFDFFKWKSLPYMIRATGRRWLRFSEWGYLLLSAILLQAVCASGLFILLPLWLAKPIKAVRSPKLAAVFYFVLLGFAYMFLEMGFIQKMTLLIGHPVFGVAVTLVGFLVLSGCGSLVSQHFRRLTFRSERSIHQFIWMVVLVIVFIGAAEIALMSSCFEWLIGLSQPVRVLLGLAITGLPAFFMGMPLPTVLKELYIHSRPLVPWAWGANGFASVTAAVLGTLLAISVGFTTLVLTALVFYLAAAVTSKKVCGS